MLKGILNFAHHLLKDSVMDGDTVIDATCGNGNDTVFLSELVGKGGSVLAFDIQSQAITATKEVLSKTGQDNVSLIQDSHENIIDYLPDTMNKKIGGAIFNLGYLPKGDKSIITNGYSTIIALDTILNHLKKDGLIVIVVYHGHEGGEREKDALLKHVIHLDQKKFHVLQYGFINQKNNPPFIIAIQKRL
jgi:16S rRNA C1402 N4-methylase RsmH